MKEKIQAIILWGIVAIIVIAGANLAAGKHLMQECIQWNEQIKAGYIITITGPMKTQCRDMGYPLIELPNKPVNEISFNAYVTGYNTHPAQTDDTPCIAASGDNICGRDDVVACPRDIPLGTEVQIDGKEYVCLDRLAQKLDHRFDISCDKDFQCPRRVTGMKRVTIVLLEH